MDSGKLRIRFLDKIDSISRSLCQPKAALNFF